MNLKVIMSEEMTEMSMMVIGSWLEHGNSISPDDRCCLPCPDLSHYPPYLRNPRHAVCLARCRVRVRCRQPDLLLRSLMTTTNDHSIKSRAGNSSRHSVPIKTSTGQEAGWIQTAINVSIVSQVREEAIATLWPLSTSCRCSQSPVMKWNSC